jgi:Tfp pilus assembly protein PilW
MTREETGFSVVELLVATTLMSIIMTAAFAVLFSGVKAQGYGAEFAHAQQKATIAMQKLTHDLRLAGRGCSPGETVFDYAGRDRVSFLVAGPTDTEPRLITYFLRPGPSDPKARVLVRCTGEDTVGKIVSSDITEFSIDYLDNDGTSLLDLSRDETVVRKRPFASDVNGNGVDDILEIKRVSILIKTRTKIPRKGIYGTCDLRTEVVPRNLMGPGGRT